MNIIFRIILLLFFLGYPLIQQQAMGAGSGEEAEKTLAVPSTSGGVLQETLTLEDCLQQIIKKNPDLATARWNIQGAEARAELAEKNRLPTLSAEGGYQYYEDPQRLIQARYNGEPGWFDNQVYRGDLIVKLPLYTGGRITNEISSSKLLVGAARERLTATSEQLIFSTKNLFYSILAQKHLFDSLIFSKNALEQQRKKIEQMMLLKKAAKLDLLRIDVRLANLVQSIVKEQSTLDIQKCTLATLMGRHCGFDLQGSLVLDERKDDKDQLVRKALIQRPDYKALKAELLSQERRIVIAESEQYPSVSFLGSYGMRMLGTGRQEGVGFAGVTVSIPLFDLRSPAKVRDEQAKQKALQEQVRKLELQVCRDVETSLLDITSSVERVKANQKAIEQAREALLIEQQKYDLAKGVMTDVLDAQTALLQSETNYYRALADFQISVAKLELSTGGSL